MWAWASAIEVKEVCLIVFSRKNRLTKAVYFIREVFEGEGLGRRKAAITGSEGTGYLLR